MSRSRVPREGEEKEKRTAMRLLAPRSPTALVDTRGPFVYYVPEVGAGWYALAQSWSWDGPPPIEIEEGFTYDLASIPRLLRWAVSPHELGLRAPLVHDYLYRRGNVTRLVADRAMRELMVEDGVVRWRRALVYGAVRAGGWLPWRRYRRAEKLAAQNP